MAESQSVANINELYTLEEIYAIELGVRGYWKCVFGKAPVKYKQKGILSISCDETGFGTTYDSMRLGLLNIYLPSVEEMPTISMTMLDDNQSTLEKWLRAWWNSTSRNHATLNYIEDYMDKVEIYQYSPQFELLRATQYLVVPQGKIPVSNKETTELTSIKVDFTVLKVLDN